MRTVYNWLCSLHARSVAAFAVVLGAVSAWAQPAGATGVIDVKGVTESATTEITANLPVILTLIGVLLAIGVVLRLVKRHAK
jgi:hypothetical protein